MPQLDFYLPLLCVVSFDFALNVLEVSIYSYGVILSDICTKMTNPWIILSKRKNLQNIKGNVKIDYMD